MSVTTYILPGGFKGKTDLLNIYAFRGNSQGDESHSNEIIDYKTSDGWMSFHFEGIDKTNQEAIYIESLRRQKLNAEYIEKCKSDGTFGERLPDIEMQLTNFPLFDDNTINDHPTRISYSNIILDTTKDNWKDLK